LALGFWVDDVKIGVCFGVILMTSSTDPTSLYSILGYNASY